MLPRARSAVVGVLASFVLCLAVAIPAHAAFPGENGKIVFGRGVHNIWVTEPDGSEESPLTSETINDQGSPAWSPDGAKIAFAFAWAGDEEPFFIYTMNADGSARTSTGQQGGYPAWSPDGQKIAFLSGPNAATIKLMNPDGTGVTTLTNQAGPPAWSPDGERIAFDYFGAVCCIEDVYVIDADGNNRTNLTNSSSVGEGDPAWSPDGTKIVFVRDGKIWVMNPDGLGQDQLTNEPNRFDYAPAWSPDGTEIVFSSLDQTSGDRQLVKIDSSGGPGTPLTALGEDYEPDWQPIIKGYPRPQGARYLRVPLVIAYEPCALPANRTHGPALSFASCNPAAQESAHLTVGTIDANGNSPKFNGAVRYFVQPGAPGGPDDSDVDLDLLATDVHNQAGLTDYAGELEARVTLRITDRQNQPSPPSGGHGTVTDLPFSFTAPCSTNSDASVGSTCQVSTTADTVAPGSAVEGKRSIWELGQITVYDGGSDGLVSTSPNTVFARQGVFVP